MEGWQIELLGGMQSWRDSLKFASRIELSAVLVATAFAAKTLKTTKLASQAFPENVLHGRQVAEGTEARKRLALYLDQVNLLRARMEHSAHRLSRLSIPGLEILVLSIGAVTQRRHLFVEGQMIWRELVRGVAEYPMVYRILLNPKASGDEIANDLFIPAALVNVAR